VALKTVHNASLSRYQGSAFPRSERKTTKRPKKVDALFFFILLFFVVIVVITINVINFDTANY
jgi:energy-coupling factor transporter transmembrane protein EcfT